MTLRGSSLALAVACATVGCDSGLGEPDDAPSGAQAVAVGSTTGGSLSSSSDEDWYQCTTPGAGYVTVTLDGLTADANLTLYSASQVYRGGSRLPSTASERVLLRIGAAETVYAVVLAAAGPTEYSLTVDFVPSDGNDAFSTAQVVSLPFATSGTIANYLDDDYYRFTIPGPGRIDVSVTNLSGDADVDLYWEGILHLVAESSNASATPETISYVAADGGNYFVLVHPWAPYPVTYDLGISFTP